MKLHEIKIENKYFWNVALGKKTAEIRKNDRDYQIGDILYLKEIEMLRDEIIYTGNYVLVQITHIVKAEEFKGLSDNYVMLSFVPLIQATNDIYDCSKYNSDIDDRVMYKYVCPAEVNEEHIKE